MHRAIYAPDAANAQMYLFICIDLLTQMHRPGGIKKEKTELKKRDSFLLLSLSISLMREILESVTLLVQMRCTMSTRKSLIK